MYTHTVRVELTRAKTQTPLDMRTPVQLNASMRAYVCGEEAQRQLSMSRRRRGYMYASNRHVDRYLGIDVEIEEVPGLGEENPYVFET